MSNFNRSPPVSGGGSNRFMSPLEEERSKNGSNAFFSPASQGSSSKAVLAALRALQDKIKRLESDKVQAEEETKHLRNQIHNKEAEFDYQKQREKMTLQRNLNETKIDYDKALIQKTKLESRLQELEDLNHELRSNTDGLVATVRNLEDDKYHKDMTLQDLQSKLLHLEMQIEVSQQRERGIECFLNKYFHTY